jgi:hypothetical protein
MIVSAANADAAKRLAQRSDEPIDIGPALKPERAAQGWRRYRFSEPDETPMPTESKFVDTVNRLIVPISALGGVALTFGAATLAVEMTIMPAALWMIIGVTLMSLGWKIDRYRRYEENLWKGIAKLMERRVIACDARWGMDEVNRALRMHRVGRKKDDE